MDQFLRIIFYCGLAGLGYGAIVEFPSQCVVDGYISKLKLNFNNQYPLAFTVDNPSGTAEDALKGSGTSYNTVSDDTFNTTVASPDFEVHFTVLKLCLRVRYVKSLTFTGVIGPLEITTIEEEHTLEDPIIWSKVCYSLPSVPLYQLYVHLEIFDRSVMEVKDYKMKYCLVPKLIV